MPSISISRKSDTRVKADITVNSEEIKSAEEQAIRKVGSEVEIKGFRKGKAPAHLVKAKFASEIWYETLRVLVDNHLAEVQKKIEERIYRLVSIEDLRQKGDKMSFAVEVDLFPYVRVGKLKVAQLIQHIPAIDDTDVENEIRNRLLKFAEYGKADEGATVEVKDRLTVDFEIWIDDAPSGEIYKDFEFELGTGSLNRQLEQQMLDKKGKVGEEFKVRKDVQAQDGGRPRSYEIIATIKEIFKPKLPELSDEFVAKNILTAQTVAEFKTRVRKDLEEDFKTAVIRSETDKALQTLEKHAQFFFSESFVEDKLEKFLDEKKLKRDNLTAPQLESLRKVIVDREKTGLLVRQLVKDAVKNYQKKNKTNLEYFELFRKYIHNQLAGDSINDDDEDDTDDLLKEFNRVIDDLAVGKTIHSPWKPVIYSSMTFFSRELLFNYFDDEGIVKKGKKLTYRELNAQLAQSTPQ